MSRTCHNSLPVKRITKETYMITQWKRRLLALGLLAFVIAGWAGRGVHGEGGEGDKEKGVQLGPNASFGGKRLLPDDNPWNQDISKEPVDPNSDNLIKSIGLNKPLHPDFGTVY